MKLKQLINWARERDVYLDKMDISENTLCESEVCVQNANYYIETRFLCGSHAREFLLVLKEELAN